MSFIDRLLGSRGINRIHTITLIGNERGGGYTYLTSPELPGFSFMLEPGEADDIKKLMNVIHEPLSTYYSAYSAHLRATSRKATPRVTGLREKKRMNFVAELRCA
ncbi:MAG: hypothetical protein WD711_04650 [Dongiaceae bacterium]